MERPERFGAILLDPPWPELGGKGRGADTKYNVIRTKEGIRDVIVGSGVFHPAENSHMYMWITNNYLTWGVWLFAELGFEVKTNFPWIKPNRPGLGQYAKGAHELLVVGTHGEADLDEPDESNLLILGTRGKGLKAATMTRSIRTDYLVGAPSETDERGMRVHSAKPHLQYDLIESRSKGPYLEMFARRRRPGWWSWGDQL